MADFAYNKRAGFEYEFLEKFTAGIQLTGHEVKSVKSGHIDLSGGRVLVRGGEVFMVGVDIASFQPKNRPEDYDALRSRKLLLERKEIARLEDEARSGLTLVPIRVFAKKGFVKIEVAIAKRKKKGDKREVVKKRESERDIARAMRR